MTDQEWVFPWDTSSAHPDDAPVCEECLTGGEGLTTWTARNGDILKTLHGRCMTTSVALMTDELAARRAAQ